MNTTRKREMEYMIQKIESLSDAEFRIFYKCFLPLYDLIDNDKGDECAKSLKEEACHVIGEETFAEQVGRQLYELRREMHISRERLCKNTNMTLARLKRIEQGIEVDFAGIDIILNYIQLTPSMLLTNIEAYVSYSSNMRYLGNLIEDKDTMLYQAMFQELMRKWMKYENDVTKLEQWVEYVGISRLYVQTIYDFSSQVQNLFDYYANRLTSIHDCDQNNQSILEQFLAKSEQFYNTIAHHL